MPKILLSGPDVGESDLALLLEAFSSGWIAPVGPFVDRFERAICELTGARHAVALSSGTAALHLALVTLGVGEGDEVVTSTLTFAASANAIRYVGAAPVFVDVDPQTWNLDPERVAEAAARRPRPPAAIMAVDLYGQCADYARLRAVAEHHGIPIVEDAAEALGATYGERAAGTLGTIGIYSFNGNKIVTTSGGGMLVTDDASLAARARHLSTQAREPVLHYEHREVGYNYRLSNLLAALGVAQLASLADKVARRRAIFERYERGLADLPGLTFMPEASYGRATRWLTCLTIERERFGEDRETVLRRLASHEIEARPVWKPMHLQPAFAEFPVVGGKVAEALFHTGLCLPSGSSLRDDDIDRVIAAVRGVREA
jgi:dTDP-4-amino-4,6-dideoxygalactose transaminase